MNLIVTSKEELQSIIINAIGSAFKKSFPLPKEDEPPKDPIFGIKEASRFLGIAIPTIYTKTSKGIIPHFKKGKRLYFRESELRNWIEDGRISTLEDEKENLNTYLNNKKGGTL